MNLSLDDEQQQLIDSVAEVLDKELPPDRRRELAHRDGPAVDADMWERFADLGWLGVGLSEDLGGVGYGLAEEALLFRELGRRLAPGPFLSCVLAARAAAGGGFAELAAAILAGTTQVGLLLSNGTAIDAPDGGIVLRLSDGQLLELADVQSIPCTDPSLRLSRVRTGSSLLSAGAPGLLDRARVLVSAMLVGNAEATRDASAEYARERVQFGKPIGSFQAVKHRCADMAIRCYAARAQLFSAALYVEADRADGAFHAASALLLADQTAERNAVDNFLNHGGIGFTDEHDAGAYMKRALILRFVAGTPAEVAAAVLAPDQQQFH